MMLRASFFAAGLFITLCGTSLLFVDRFVIKEDPFSSGTVTANSQAVPNGVSSRAVSQQNDGGTPPQQAQRPQGFRGFFGASPAQPAGYAARSELQQPRVIDPPDWAAFSLLSIGTVTMLYSFALPKRKGG